MPCLLRIDLIVWAVISLELLMKSIKNEYCYNNRLQNTAEKDYYYTNVANTRTKKTKIKMHINSMSCHQ